MKIIFFCRVDYWGYVVSKYPLIHHFASQTPNSIRLVLMYSAAENNIENKTVATRDVCGRVVFNPVNDINL